MDKVAVVILNWNGSGMLRRFLPGVLRCTEADGGVVWLADNGSTDDSVSIVSREFPSVRLIRLEKNYGFAEGYNRALAQVAAEYVVLLNSDVEVTEHWLRPCWPIWRRIPRWPPASPRFSAIIAADSLSMPALPADSSTVMDIHFAEGA